MNKHCSAAYFRATNNNKNEIIDSLIWIESLANAIDTPPLLYLPYQLFALRTRRILWWLGWMGRLCPIWLNRYEIWTNCRKRFAWMCKHKIGWLKWRNSLKLLLPARSTINKLRFFINSKCWVGKMALVQHSYNHYKCESTSLPCQINVISKIAFLVHLRNWNWLDDIIHLFITYRFDVRCKQAPKLLLHVK